MSLKARYMLYLVMWLAINFFSVAMSVTAFAGQIIYVDGDASRANNGTSWTDAHNYLQDALADANSSDKPVEIRVARGVYKPDQGANQTPGDRAATFQLINSVAIKGGYAGLGECDPDARDIAAYETILSGDLAGDDLHVNDLSKLYSQRDRRENSQHVVTGSGTDATAILDGFRVTAGCDLRPLPMVFHPPDFYGGGMVILAGSPTVIQCTFVANANYSGGAMAILEASNPTLVNCRFEHNYAWHGGAISNANSNPSLIGCHFYQNLAGHSAAISHTQGGSIQLRSCSFVQNAAEYSAAAIDVPSVGGTIDPATIKQTCFVDAENCLFAGNTANKRLAWWVHGVVVYGRTWLRNCTFSGNAVTYGAVGTGETLLENCIIWDNFSTGGPSIVNGRSAPPEPGLIYHCCVQDSPSYPHEYGNIHSDPRFADPGYWDPNGTPQDANDDFWVDGDYHLRSQAGRWEPETQSWVKDDVTSPCIDAGDPMSPIGHEPFPNGGIINMGAYGGTAEASKSYFGEPVCETIVAGDINGDCKVDWADFTLLALHWLEDKSE